MVTIPHIMVGLERMSDYRGVRLERFHCSYIQPISRKMECPKTLKLIGKINSSEINFLTEKG